MFALLQGLIDRDLLDLEYRLVFSEPPDFPVLDEAQTQGFSQNNHVQGRQLSHRGVQQEFPEIRKTY